MKNKCSTKVAYAGKSVALLTYTSTMSCWSFSLPAGKHGACPFMDASGEDKICAGCYAQINRYNMPNVLEAQHVRFNWLRLRLNNQKGRDEIVRVFNEALRADVTNGYFRVHDSGDFFSKNYTEVWYEICKANPHIVFWFPTRVYSRLGKTVPADWQQVLIQLSTLPNVSVRASALSYNEIPPSKINTVFRTEGTTVLTGDTRLNGVAICAKSEHGGSCESNNCRTCWDSRDTPVAYLIHGFNGSDKAPVLSDKILNLRKQVALTVRRKEYAAAV